jgi:hypothetical protein
MVEVDLASWCSRHGNACAGNHLHGVEPMEDVEGFFKTRESISKSLLNFTWQILCFANL